jgi:hypothetical protein
MADWQGAYGIRTRLAILVPGLERFQQGVIFPRCQTCTLRIGKAKQNDATLCSITNMPLTHYQGTSFAYLQGSKCMYIRHVMAILQL